MSNENHSGQGPFLTARELAPYALARLVEEKQAGRLNYVHACLIPDRWDEVGVTVFLRPDWNIQAVTAIVEPICTDDFGIAWAPIAVVPEFCLSGEPTAPVITNDVCRRILELRARVREEEGDPLALVLPGLWAIVRSGFEQTVLQIGFRIELSGEDQIKFAWQLASTLKEPFKLYIGGFNMDVSWERKPALVENQIDRPNPSLLDILVRAGTVLRTLTEECLAYGDDPDNHPLPQETRVCEEGAADLNIAPGSIVITRPNLTVVFQPQATETEGTTEAQPDMPIELGALGAVLRTVAGECLSYGTYPIDHKLPRGTCVYEEGTEGPQIPPGSIVFDRPDLGLLVVLQYREPTQPRIEADTGGE